MMLADTLPTDPRDLAVFSQTPMFMAPRFGHLPRLTTGRRYIAAEDGIYVEAISSTLHVCIRLSKCMLPFGKVEAFMKFRHGRPAVDFLEQAISHAKEKCPVEWAGTVYQTSVETELFTPDVIAEGRGHVSYANTLDESRLTIDIHSHGQIGAYFSSTDDADDIGNASPVFIAGVIGKCDKAVLETTWRLVIGSHFIPLPYLPFADSTAQATLVIPACGTISRQ